MQVKHLLIFLIIIALIITYNVVLSSQKLCIRINIDKPYSNVNGSLEYLFCALTCKSNIEYEQDDLIILGGNIIWLPQKNAGINIQCCLKEVSSGCTLILAYPALPLESY